MSRGKRVVIQVTAAAATYGDAEDMAADGKIVALCDDSTIWWIALFGSEGWHEVTPVPGSVADKGEK